jgi:DNA-binding transcriptional LysR family regulator
MATMELRKNMKDLNEVQCFVRTVECKSLTAASKVLGLPKSSISRKIRNLESRLGMTLLIRTTRAINLTDAGRIFFEKSAFALKEIDQAEETLDGSRQEVEGTLRITAPMIFATGHFNDLIASFLESYPKVKIDLVLTERVVDLISESFDLAFRLGDLDDSTLKSKKLNSFDACILASPQYIKIHGVPKTYSELEKHECIVFSPIGEAISWNLKGPSGKKEFTPRGRLNVNDIASVKEAILKGVGIGILPTYMAAEELENGKLKHICPEWTSRGAPINLVYPGQKFIAPKMRAFIDFTSEHLAL